jgi:hypothetical protein
LRLTLVTNALPVRLLQSMVAGIASETKPFLPPGHAAGAQRVQPQRTYM